MTYTLTQTFSTLPRGGIMLNEQSINTIINLCAVRRVIIVYDSTKPAAFTLPSHSRSLSVSLAPSFSASLAACQVTDKLRNTRGIKNGRKLNE